MSTRRATAMMLLAGILAVSVPGCGGGSDREAAPVDAAAIVRDFRKQVSGDPDHDMLRALLVQVDGHLVVEEYFGGARRDSYWGIASVTKSVVSTLIGIAISEGRLPGVEATLAELLPRHAPGMSPAVAQVTLHRLLTMTAGFPAGADELAALIGARDPVAGILRGSRGARGDFEYSDRGAHLVAQILAEAIDTSILDYARSRLFDPLGIDSKPAFQPGPSTDDARLRQSVARYQSSDFAWPVDSAGVNTGWGLLRLRPIDMLRLGQLFLNEGRWEGRQLVPASWVREATAAQVRTPDGGYGYEWWVTKADGERAYQALGFAGQLVEVVPSRNLVVAVATESDPLAGLDEGISPSIIGFLVSDIIAPAVSK